MRKISVLKLISEQELVREHKLVGEHKLAGKQVGERFPRCARVVRRWEYAWAREHGRKCSSKHLFLLVFNRSEPELSRRARLGITVSKKVGKAVHRNRVKRRLREIFRRHQGEFPPVTIVAIAKRGAATASFQELKSELLRLVGQGNASTCLSRAKRSPSMH